MARRETGQARAFLCDEMLQQLGQWLRVAGYDTVFPDQGTEDRQVLAMAIRQRRWLLTRDQDFQHLAGSEGHVLFLEEENWIAQASQLGRRLGIDWLYRPFSRCKRCNSLLESPPGESLDREKPNWTDPPEDIRYCPHCRQLFWKGSHVRRMYRQLCDLNSLSN